jgi:hypothetical protein
VLLSNDATSYRRWSASDMTINVAVPETMGRRVVRGVEFILARPTFLVGSRKT